ncbi:MAG: hypothetical protein WBA74_19155, partial [Cyclobacteriaceae bacterium]
MLKNFLSTVILMGALQGFVSLFLLSGSWKPREAKSILRWLILLISLACLNIFFFQSAYEFKPEIIQSFFNTLPLILIMPVGPLIYFYVRKSLNEKEALSRKSQYHFYPVLIDLMPYMIGFVALSGWYGGLLEKSTYAHLIGFTDVYQKYADIPRWLSITTYLIISLRLLRNQPSHPKINWLWQFVIVFAVFHVVWFIFLVFYLIPSTSSWILERLDWYPLYIPLTII